PGGAGREAAPSSGAAKVIGGGLVGPVDAAAYPGGGPVAQAEPRDLVPLTDREDVHPHAFGQVRYRVGEAAAPRDLEGDQAGLPGPAAGAQRALDPADVQDVDGARAQ